jgi:regulator of replication initiation timing
MGNAGNVAYHTHIEVQRGKYKKYTGTRYQSGIKGYVYMFPNTVEPYNALYLAKDAVMNEGDIQYSWKRITDVISPQERNTNVNQVKVLVDLLRVRSDHLTAAEMIGYAQKDGYYNDLAVYDDGTYTWHKIADDQWIADGGDWVEILPGVNGEMIDLRDTIVNLQETVSRLQLDLENKDALIKKIQDSLDSALSENRKLQLMYDDLLEDHDKAVAMYETLSQKYTITIAKIQTAYEKLLEAFKEVLP